MLAEVQQHGTLTEDQAMDAFTKQDNKNEEQETLEGVEDGKEESQAIKPTTLAEAGDFEKAVQINHQKLANVDDKIITDALAELEKIDEERSALNARAGAARANVKRYGIPVAALNAAYARYKMGDKKRAVQDAAIAKCTNAMGVGFTQGLF